MTSKDFDLIAKAMKSRLPYVHNQLEWGLTVETLANVLFLENNAFDYSKFYTACGLEIRQ